MSLSCPHLVSKRLFLDAVVGARHTPSCQIFLAHLSVLSDISAARSRGHSVTCEVMLT